MKTFNFFLLLLSFSINARGQMTSGMLTYVYIDSMQPKPGLYSGSDTVIAIMDGEPSVYVINDTNRSVPFEASRDTVDFYFTPEKIISQSRGSDLFRYYDLAGRKSKNMTNRNGTIEEIMTFSLYNDFWPNENPTQPEKQTEPSECGARSGFSCYHESYRINSTQTGKMLKRVDLCLTDDIQIPIKIFTHYWSDKLACPVKMESRKENYRTEVRLIRALPMEKGEVNKCMDDLMFKK